MRSAVESKAGLIFLFVLFIVFSISAFAQSEEQMQNSGDDEKYKKTAAELTQSLSQKVNLTPEQSEMVTTSLVEYQKNISDIATSESETEIEGKISELHNNLKSKVSSILEENQMTAFNNIESQWFQEVRNKTHSATVRKSETKDEQY